MERFLFKLGLVVDTIRTVQFDTRCDDLGDH